MSEGSRRRPGQQPGPASGHDEFAEEMASGASVHAQEPVHSDHWEEAWDRPWEPPSQLEAPPPRHGMAQRWIRTHVAGQEDVNNVQKAFREGWRPRRAETIPQGFAAASLSEGRYAGIVGIHGMILCEMPASRLEQRRVYYKEASNTQMRSVQADLEAQQHPVLGQIKQAHQETVTKGRRRPPVQTSIAANGDV